MKAMYCLVNAHFNLTNRTERIWIMIEKYGTDLSQIEATEEQLDEIRDLLDKTAKELPKRKMSYQEALDYILKEG